MESPVVINNLEKARELISTHVRELYKFKFGKVAELEDLIKYLEGENVEKDIILTALSDVGENSSLNYDKKILVGLRPENIASSKVLTVNHPIYSFCEDFDPANFVEEYQSIWNGLQRNTFKEVVRRMFNFYYKRKRKQQTII